MTTPFQCEAPCPLGHFCGDDLECRPYGCDEWYHFGGSNATDYDPSLPLLCEERSQWDAEFPGLVNAGVVFGCGGYTGDLPSPPIAVYQPFTRKCTRADDEKPEKFVCYEMADKTNFQNFVVEANEADLNPWCVRLISKDELRFHYEVVLEQPDYDGPFPGISTVTMAGRPSKEFDSTSAMRSMFAKLEIVDNPVPTPVPPPYSASFLLEPSTVLFFGMIHTFRCFM